MTQMMAPCLWFDSVLGEFKVLASRIWGIYRVGEGALLLLFRSLTGPPQSLSGLQARCFSSSNDRAG